MRKAWVCALLWAPAALAFDPRYQWLTLDTPHFEIHFHQGEYGLAAKVARIAEEAHARLSPLLEHEPSERTQIVLTDDSREAFRQYAAETGLIHNPAWRRFLGLSREASEP